MTKIRIIAILLSLTFVGGCAILPLGPSVYETAPVESWICVKANELGVKVEDMDLLLQIATLRLLDKDDVKKALKFFDNVERYIANDILYRELIDYVRKEVKLTGPEILIVSRYLPHLYLDSLISNYDKMLILAHIDHQRALLR